VSFITKNLDSSHRRAVKIVAQGLVEKAFPGGPDEACTERLAFAQRQGWQGPDDGGFSLHRGLFAGELAEHELQQYASYNCFTIGLGEIADQILHGMKFGQLGIDGQHEIRELGVRWIRRWQEQFPPDDPDLDLDQPMVNLLAPQTDLFVRRPDRFAVRVRPDNVIGVGNVLVAWERSTAKDPHAISRARFALNHHALLRERLRRPEWVRFNSIKTRVEMLALGYGFTVSLSGQDAETWRVAIGNVTEAVVDGLHEPNRGPHCSTCRGRRTVGLGMTRRRLCFSPLMKLTKFFVGFVGKPFDLAMLLAQVKRAAMNYAGSSADR
jgi:hypothetical protein